MNVKMKLLNGLLFNVGWLACVVLRNWQAGLVVILVLSAYIYMEKSTGRAITLLLVATTIGFAVDNALLYEGILYPYGSGRFAPFWMTALWPMLATTFNVAMQALQQRLVLAAVLGAVSAPLSYLTAVRLGAAEFGVPTVHALIGIGFIWMIIFPLGLQFTRQLMRPVDIAV